MSVKCPVCPNSCNISDGSFGMCGVRGASDGKSYLPYNGAVSAAAMDPIEKKPLYHYKPASEVFSVGFYGCSLSCPFCQNHHISKDLPKPAGLKYFEPEEIIDAAVGKGALSIAYTYSEPLIHFEWIYDCMQKASIAGLNNILVTNGYINAEPADMLLKYTDAVNVDLKSFNPDFYRKELKGKLQPVLAFIEKAAGASHTEITTLVIPSKNDDPAELSSAADFIASIDINIPWHLSAYYPAYHYSLPPTPPSLLRRLAENANDKLNFVFTGNIVSGLADTLCPECGNLLISRSGYFTSLQGIAEGLCDSCGASTAEYGIVL